MGENRSAICTQGGRVCSHGTPFLFCIHVSQLYGKLYFLHACSHNDLRCTVELGELLTACGHNDLRDPIEQGNLEMLVEEVVALMDY